MTIIKSKMKALKKKFQLASIVIYLCLSKANVFADSDVTENLKDTKVVKGTIKLFDDATSAALLIAPAIGIVLGVYFHIRKSAADEQDQKLWDKRIHTVIFCVIAATVFTSVLKTILTYYK